MVTQPNPCISSLVVPGNAVTTHQIEKPRKAKKKAIMKRSFDSVASPPYPAPGSGPESPRVDWTSILSHELLSPLALIRGYTTFVLQQGDLMTGSQKKRYLRGIELATDRAIRIVSDLRDLTLLGQSLNTERTSLPHIVRQVVSEIGVQVSRHHIRFRYPGSLPKVDTDQQRLKQVIVNLVNNAIKYSPEGAQVEITIRLIKDEADLGQTVERAPRLRLPCLLLSVSDSGMGIAKADLERVFEPYYRAANSAKSLIPGTGLGLYISRLIVEAHGGRIWARSRAEGGSIFNFSLPLPENTEKLRV